MFGSTLDTSQTILSKNRQKSSVKEVEAKKSLCTSIASVKIATRFVPVPVVHLTEDVGMGFTMADRAATASPMARGDTKPPQQSQKTISLQAAGLAAGQPGSAPARVAADFAPLFVWATWAACALAVVVFVFQFVSRYVPVWDEWDGIISVIAGLEPFSFKWLWSLHNEHRVALPRLVLLAVLLPTRGDLRAVVLISALGLIALTLAMINTARKLRGRTAYADAFFPIVVLNLGQFENLLVAWQIQMVLSTLLAGFLLCLIASRSTVLTPLQTLLAGSCYLLLPLCGANGVVLIPALAVWLAAVAGRAWRARPVGWWLTVIEALAFGLAGLILLVLYFVNFERPPHHPPSAGLWPAVAAGLDVLSCVVGPAVAVAWRPWLAYGLGGLAIVTCGVLGWVWWARPGERFRAAGLFLVGVALACLMAGIGWGRSGFAPGTAIASRYVTITAPMLCALYYVWVLRGGATGELVQTVMFVFMAALIWPNVQNTLAFAQDFRRRTRAFEDDLHAGVPVSFLTYRHYPLYVPDTWGIERVMPRLNGLRHFRSPFYRSMKADPAFQAIPLDVAQRVLRMQHMTVVGDDLEGSGADASVILALPEPRFIYGIRFKVDYGETKEPALCHVQWRQSGRNEFSETERTVSVERLNDVVHEHVVGVWVNDTVDQIVISPEFKACAGRLSQIELLVPAES
jgi:hypothetical protein